MNRALATLAVALGAAAAATTPAAGASPCHIPGGQAVAKGRIAELVAIPTTRGSALFACIRRSGRKVALDDSYTDARLSGRWVAWERRGTPTRRRIAVHDLRTGKERLVDGHVAEHSLRVTSRGTIVWAQAKDAAPDTPLFANDTLDGGRLLDGGAVDAASVRLAGRRVSWLSGGVQRSAVVY